MTMKTGNRQGKFHRGRRGRLTLTVKDIRDAQNGDAKAWERIREYFKPRIRVMVYQYRPGYTAQDYRDRKMAAEAALLETLMNFKLRC